MSDAEDSMPPTHCRCGHRLAKACPGELSRSCDLGAVAIRYPVIQPTGATYSSPEGLDAAIEAALKDAS